MNVTAETVDLFLANTVGNLEERAAPIVIPGFTWLKSVKWKTRIITAINRPQVYLKYTLALRIAADVTMHSIKK